MYGLDYAKSEEEPSHKFRHISNTNYYIVSLILNTGYTLFAWVFFVLTCMTKNRDTNGGESKYIYCVLASIFGGAVFTLIYIVFQMWFSSMLFYMHYDNGDSDESHPLAIGVVEWKGSFFLHYFMHIYEVLAWFTIALVGLTAFKYYCIQWGATDAIEQQRFMQDNVALEMSNNSVPQASVMEEKKDVENFKITEDEPSSDEED